MLLFFSFVSNFVLRISDLAERFLLTALDTVVLTKF